jgi:cold shock CspA family protein
VQGIITKYFDGRSYGFIKADNSSDIFFHKSAMAPGTEPEVDMVVEFVEEIGRNGRLRAINVRPI